MPESAGARVDTHVHVHVSELTEEELEAKRQAEVAQEEEDERNKVEEEKTPASIRENPGQSNSPQNVVDLGRNSSTAMGNEQCRRQLMKRMWFEFIRKKYRALGSQRRLVHQE